MQRFHGCLRDGDQVIFEQVAGYLEDHGGGASADGNFDVHQGGILGGSLPTDRPLCLDLEDGRTGSIRLTKVHASNSAGIARMEFRLDGGLAQRPDGIPVPALG
jgi:hypothetical protein